MPNDAIQLILLSLAMFASVFLLVRFCGPPLLILARKQERRLDDVLNRQLLLDIPPRASLISIGVGMIVIGMICAALAANWVWFFPGAAVTIVLPNLVINHLETKRRKRLEEQIIDGVTAMSSGVRAGLNLVQSMQLLVKNATGPIQQEFAQLLREYELGVDLNQAMLNTAERIGSSPYRLLFSAISAHRTRGGDVAQSLDRIADAIREIQRLEGKLQSLTAQGRNQAGMMALMAVAIGGIGYLLAPEETAGVIEDPRGRLILLIAAFLVTVGFLWIRKIMSVDI
ncbi:MAG: type II secretion system F family protein [Phycisphaeraceae bacterium]